MGQPIQKLDVRNLKSWVQGETRLWVAQGGSWAKDPQPKAPTQEVQESGGTFFWVKKYIA